MTLPSTRSLEVWRWWSKLGRLVGTALVVVLVPAAARADVPLDLTWSAPAGCPQDRDVRERIRTIAGDALRGMTRLRADGRIARVDGRYQLTLRVYEAGAARDRTIDSTSCADLAGAAAVSLGLLLRNGGSSVSEQPAPASEPASRSRDANRAVGGDPANRSAPSAAPSVESPGASRTETPRSLSLELADAAGRVSLARPFRAFLRAPLLGSVVGRLPSPAWGLGVGAGVRYRQWRVAVDARIFVEQSLWSSQFPDVGVKVSPRALSLSACRGFRRSSWELAPCLSIGAEQLLLRGTGPHVTARHESTTTFVLGAAGAAHLYFSEWVALLGTATLGLETARPRLAIAGLGDVQRLGPLRLDVSVGAEWIF